MRKHATPPNGRPLVIYDKVKNAFSLVALDRQASAKGLHVGMSLADALAMQPHLMAVQYEPDADAKFLDEIAAWCDRFSPFVVLDPPHSLLLDVTGCTHLFGGTSILINEIEERIKAEGLALRLAIAPTIGAAWALSRMGGLSIIEPHELKQSLSKLPVNTLRLTQEATALLRRLGLKSIGQIMDAPRKPFAARAGQHAMLRLDQALGNSIEIRVPRRPPPALFALRRLVEPILALESVLIVADALCVDLCTQLNQRGCGVQLLRLTLFGVDNHSRTVQLGLSRAECNSAIIVRLLRERLSVSPETLNAEFGFDAVRLDALEITPILLRSVDLAPKAGRDKEAEARLVDRLVARLGSSRIGRPALNLVHAPERSNQWVMADNRAYTPSCAFEDGVMRRPLQLFAHAQIVEAIASMPDGPPMRFRWRRVLHEVQRAEGPERITPDWLRAPKARSRDYYRVEDKEGRRFWLYREDYNDRQDAPRWYVHGVFA